MGRRIRMRKRRCVDNNCSFTEERMRGEEKMCKLRNAFMASGAQMAQRDGG